MFGDPDRHTASRACSPGNKYGFPLLRVHNVDQSVVRGHASQPERTNMECHIHSIRQRWEGSDGICIEYTILGPTYGTVAKLTFFEDWGGTL